VNDEALRKGQRTEPTVDGGASHSQRLTIAVDLLPLRPGGENGGIKPAIFALLRAVRAEGDLICVFLTNSTTHEEVRALAAPDDLLVCLGEELERARDKLPNEFKLIPVPPGFIKRIAVDLLYCPFGATTFHASGVPTIALVADLLHRDFPSSLTEPEREVRESYIQKTVRVAAKLQCISRSAMERMVEHYQVPREKLFWTYLPIHRRLDRVAPAHDLPVAVGRPFFFYPANLWPHKNHEVLLRAYAEYQATAGPAAWDLVLTFQEDSRAPLLKSLTDDLGIAAQVHFAGFVTDEQLHRIWKEAGALVFPSLHEGFGIPLLEAMHFGVPIITGTDFSLKEIAGDACVPVDSHSPTSLAAALLEVSRNDQLRRELVKRGRERLQLFDLQVAATRLLEEFQSATQSARTFPRRPPRVFGVVTAPTPSSDERWKIEVSLKPAAFPRRFLFYLDDVLFSSALPISSGTSIHSFFCRPQGRLLVVQQKGVEQNSTEGTEESVEAIVAIDEKGRRLVLFEGGNHATK